MNNKYEIEFKKSKLIDEIIKDFEKLKPNKQEVEEYKTELKKLKINEVKLIKNNPVPMTIPRLKVNSFIKKLNKKNALLIHMYRKNGTIDHFVISVKKRSFDIKNNKYMVDLNCTTFDTTYKLQSLSYHENVVMPFKVSNVKNNELIQCDPEQFKVLFKFEYVQLLANITQVKDLIKFILGVTILCLIAIVINVALSVHGFKLI